MIYTLPTCSDTEGDAISMAITDITTGLQPAFLTYSGTTSITINPTGLSPANYTINIALTDSANSTRDYTFTI